MARVTRLIFFSFHFLLFIVPLVFYPRTSELFEFNKIVSVYILTTVIAMLWAVESILLKKAVFKRTVFDIPILVFLVTQGISTIFSIEPRTSFLGYYSRFNGGLLSSFSYALLYWAFVSHFDKKQTLKIVRTLFISSSIAAIWGVLEHFGKSPSCLIITGNFDASCWVQDVQLRVFATFGQPNWMAAWIVALIPLAWVSVFRQKKNNNYLLEILLSFLFFSVLLFTKSRSGILACSAAILIFFSYMITKNPKIIKKLVNRARIALIVSLFLAAILFGTPWSRSIGELMQNNTATAEQPKGPALETGGTESGTIRRIVWEGAINVWREYPLFGSGVETFALSYYKGRPMEHNNVSEWNFLYNKAHNEYLNFLATSGLVGFGSYLFLVGAVLKYLVVKVRAKDNEESLFIRALLAGFVSILITNFFGFSVVPVSLLFFLFPAFAVSIHSSEEAKKISINVNTTQMVGVATVFFIGLYSLYSISNYWNADYLYAQASRAMDTNDYTTGVRRFNDAIALSPDEPLYHAELASLYADLAEASVGESQEKITETFITAADRELETTRLLASQNVRHMKSIANSYATLGSVSPDYYLKTLDVTSALLILAPTDPSVVYQRALTFAKLSESREAITSAERAVEMKPNYKIARRLLAFLYRNDNQTEKARDQLKYILLNISPDDVDVQKELQELK